jgi:glycosyltransferase involved in cell wall biosynthesis
MRLLIVTQYFPPEMGASQTRLFELSTRLIKMGFEVTVLTGMPNYPTGRIFDNYRWRIRMTEEIDGLKIIRTCLYPSKSRKFLPRLFSYISFALSSVLLGVWDLGTQDLVLVDSPPPFLVPSAIVISRIAKAKPVMMVADIWPDIIIRMGHASEQSISVKAMLWLEKFCYNHTYAVAFSNPAACEQIRQRFPHLKNITVISNGVDTNTFRPELRSEEARRKFNIKPDDFLVAYCGLHGLAQGLEVVLAAAEKLQDDSRIKFVMIGDGPTKEDLVRKANEMKLTNLTFYPHRPKSEMPEIMASSDASLVTLSGRFPGTMPSKVYEALASGAVPIVAKGCEAEPLVNQYNAGRCYEPGDAGELAAAICELANNRDLLRQVRANGIELSKRFDRALIAERTAMIVTAIAEGKPLPKVSW